MNYQKLDAALAMAVNQVEDPQEANLVIFIHTQQPLDENALAKLNVGEATPKESVIAFLQRLGINNITANTSVFTVTVSLNTISELSQQSWIQYLKLSQKLHLTRKI